MQLALEPSMVSVSRRLSRQPDSRNNGTARRIWLLLYAEGGYWTSEEIGRRLMIARPLWNSLGEMVRGGFLSAQRVTNIDGESAVKYGVTRPCKVPRGVTVDELWEVLTGRAQ